MGGEKVTFGKAGEQISTGGGQVGGAGIMVGET